MTIRLMLLEEVPPAAPVDQTLACLRREDKIKCVNYICTSVTYNAYYLVK